MIHHLSEIRVNLNWTQYCHNMQSQNRGVRSHIMAMALLWAKFIRKGSFEG